MTEDEKNRIRGLLLDAEVAYHRLMIGQSFREFVDQNGEKVVYTSANATLLSAYIRDLKELLNPRPNANAPLGYIF